MACWGSGFEMPLTHFNEDCLAESWANFFFLLSYTGWLWQITVFPFGPTLCCNITKIKVIFPGTGEVLQRWKSLHRGLKIHKSVSSFTEVFNSSLWQYAFWTAGISFCWNTARGQWETLAASLMMVYPYLLVHWKIQLDTLLKGPVCAGSFKILPVMSEVLFMTNPWRKHTSWNTEHFL